METLGRYEIRGELGRGGMGVVYRAYDPALDREVAIKSVRLEGIDEDARTHLEQRLAREAKAAAKLQHPSIVAVYDFFRIEDRAYIVMEFVRGSMLDAMIAAGNRDNLAAILKVLRQTASALDEAHKQGIVHRDIKPGNILLDEAGNIKITDFGIARMTTPGATETMSQGLGSTVGTLGYMAPEQIRGEAVDGCADQFSLGVVAYQLFSGEMPFQADSWIALSYKIIHEDPPSLIPKCPAVTPGIEAALKRAIAKQPGERFPSCSAFVEALASATPSTAQVKPIPAAVSGRKPVFRLAAAALFVLVLCAWWFGFRPSSRTTTPPQSEPTPSGEKLAYVPPAPATPAPPPPTEVKPDPLPEPIEFVKIPAGRFFMGSDSEETDQRPRHMVRITRPFEMAKTETTDAQWNLVMGSGKGGSNLPKTNVSWNQTQAFIARLNQRGDGYLYRLPTEAEWEYAARANTPTDRPRNLDEVAWYRDNSGQHPHEVATLLPNAFGLHDMIGNVFEWVSDWAEVEYYANSPETDPKGPPEGKGRIQRGGGYDSQGMVLTTGWRFAGEPDSKSELVGFRVVRLKR